MSPGSTGIGGRPRPTPSMKMYSYLMPKSTLTPKLILCDTGAAEKSGDHTLVPKVLRWNKKSSELAKKDGSGSPTANHARAPGATKTSFVPLLTFACGRSGDKGDLANIGILVRHPQHYSHLLKILTSATVKAYFGDHCGTVSRFELPGIYAVNFLLTTANGGGGVASLHSDALAKTYAQRLLQMRVPAPPSEGGGGREARL